MFDLLSNLQSSRVLNQCSDTMPHPWPSLCEILLWWAQVLVGLRIFPRQGLGCHFLQSPDALVEAKISLRSPLLRLRPSNYYLIGWVSPALWQVPNLFHWVPLRVQWFLVHSTQTMFHLSVSDKQWVFLLQFPQPRWVHTPKVPTQDSWQKWHGDVSQMGGLCPMPHWYLFATLSHSHQIHQWPQHCHTWDGPMQLTRWDQSVPWMQSQSGALHSWASIWRGIHYYHMRQLTCHSNQIGSHWYYHRALFQAQTHWNLLLPNYYYHLSASKQICLQRNCPDSAS